MLWPEEWEEQEMWAAYWAAYNAEADEQASAGVWHWEIHPSERDAPGGDLWWLHSVDIPF
jgi:hypothetical protein